MWRAALFITLLTSAVCSSCVSTAGGGSSKPSTGGTAASLERFLSSYVTSDGRVIRHDQGGDIVSEGQAYGMLIAELAGNADLARTIWSWTEVHLQRPDGLFAWHANGNGQVESNQSATDADVLIAYDLLRYRGQRSGSLHSAGRRVAKAALAHESVARPGGPVLVAGPWATSPPIVDPSYLMPGVFSALAAYTGDTAWQRAARQSVALVSGLTAGGKNLPADWSQLAGSRLVPISAPGTGGSPQYGFDAVRLPLWFASACSPAARTLAADWWKRALSVDGRAATLPLSLSGQPMQQTSNPVSLMAAAAAATAAGDSAAGTRLVATAEQEAKNSPTYYGDAWVALGTALIDKSLDPCSEA